MEGVLFVLGIEETIKQIYNRDKYLKMKINYGRSSLLDERGILWTKD